MSIPHSNSEIADVEIPQLYLLQMDSNLKSNDPQVFPLQIMNNIMDYNHKQLLQLKQINSKEETVQHELLIDACPESAVKFLEIKMDKSHKPDHKQTQLSFPLRHIIPSVLTSGVNSKRFSVEATGTEMTASSLTNIYDQDVSLANKKKGIQNYVHIPDRSILPRAIAVLPSVLQIRRKDMISPRRVLPPHTRFGPVQGVKHKLSSAETNELIMASIENKTPVFLLRDEDGLNTLIDVSDKDKANWIGLLPLGDDNTANLWIYEENNELFVITTEAVPLRKQLMLGYSKKYAEDYGLIGPTKGIESESSPIQRSWWCYECQREMSSTTLLQRHMNTYHQEDNPAVRRRYRCRYCSRTFSRIFTLRRHVAHNCEKKLSKSDTISSTEMLPEASLNSSLNTDDNRVPSDESFQNYSNGLDFSTNLFDTDRMPSLYISGNSRCEVFNPYGLDSENTLTNDLGFANGSSNKADSPNTDNNKKKLQEKLNEPSLTPCPYCKQEVVKGKKRQHVNECRARQFECECKKVFPNKEQLALHIFTQHSNEKQAEENEKNENNTPSTKTDQNPTPYLCEQCPHSFKRRGMLVNHLWRVHKMAAARVPMERRVRHYPCAACPKIYRTAAKRDRHVTVHHPGAEKVRAAPLEGGTRPCSPAACTACPRQYATRAKLLQHVRCRHPHLVPPPRKKTNLTQKSNSANDRLKASEELLKNKNSLQQLLNFY